jgi:hypothetical protein
MFGIFFIPQFHYGTWQGIRDYLYYPIPFFIILIPILYSKLHKEDTKILSEKVKEYEPIVNSQISITSNTLESIYDFTLSWLKSIDAEIYEEKVPEYVQAFHQVIDSYNDGLGTSNEPENMEKFFIFKLREDVDEVIVDMEIHQGWEKTILDGYKRRRSAWTKFANEYCDYVNGVISSQKLISDPDDLGKKSFFSWK